MQWSASRRAACGQSSRGLGVPDRLDDVAVLRVPPRPPPGAAPRPLRVGAPQLEPQEVGEQVVVAEPRPLGVERDDERVRVLQVLQDALRARAAGQDVGKRRRSPARGPTCAAAAAAPLAADAPAPRPAGTRPRSARCRRTRRTNRSGSGWPASESAASRSPAAHPSVRSCSSATPSSDSTIPDACQQLARLVEREAQIGARISVSSPARRRRCSPSCGSSRVASTTRSAAAGGRAGARAARAPLPSAARAGRR